MSILSTPPKNQNLLQPTKFIVTFPEVSDTIFFCQKANIPGVQLNEMQHVTPNLDLFVAGTKMTYNTFDITFNVNEDLSAWREVHDWIRGITTDMRDRTKTNIIATLTVMSNMNNPKIRVKLNNIFPLSLSDLQFDVAESADNIMTATATFRFDYFDIEVLP